MSSWEGVIQDLPNAELLALAADIAAVLRRRRLAGGGLADPPLGYGYRQVYGSPREAYALRWGRSGRITGYAHVDPSNAYESTPDPATLVFLDSCAGLTWANMQRWEPVTRKEG